MYLFILFYKALGTIIFPRLNNLIQTFVGMVTCSKPRSTTKLSHKRMELKRWSLTEKGWKQNRVDHSILRWFYAQVQEYRNKIDGWFIELCPQIFESSWLKVIWFGKFAYLSDLLEATSSAAAPGVKNLFICFISCCFFTHNSVQTRPTNTKS